MQFAQSHRPPGARSVNQVTRFKPSKYQSAMIGDYHKKTNFFVKPSIIYRESLAIIHDLSFVILGMAFKKTEHFPHQKLPTK